jgi:2'-5' RNA ligase
MRLFIALNFPHELRVALHEAAAPLRSLAPAARWTAAARLHLTMKFLGEEPAELGASLAPVLDAAGARHAPIDLSIEGIGAFPNFRRPRVVWAGIGASRALVALQRDIDDVCAALGLAREDRPFHPHVTLARIGPRVPRDQARALGLEHDRIVMRGAATVRTVDLMESVGGAYVALHRAPLAG